MYRKAGGMLVAMMLCGCGHTLTSTTYRVNVGRQVTEFLQSNATTTWSVGAEFHVGK